MVVRTLSAPEGELEASFVPELGMLGCSLRHRGEELLELRGGVERYAETGKTAGIPLLAPWANRVSRFSFEVAGRTVRLAPETPGLHLDPGGLPIHGLAATLPWEEVEVEAARLAGRLDLGAVPAAMEAFPFPQELGFEAEIDGTALRITTTLTPTADVAAPVSFGYHPYLHLPGVPRAEWEITLPVRRRLVLDDRSIPTGQTEPVSPIHGALGDRTFDDGYDRLGDPARFELAGGGRRLVVDFGRGYPVAQVFAPPASDFICFEPMTAPTDALVSGRDLPFAAPGEPFAATFTISVD